MSIPDSPEFPIGPVTPSKAVELADDEELSRDVVRAALSLVQTSNSGPVNFHLQLARLLQAANALWVHRS